MDRATEIVANKRTERWPKEWREWLRSLPPEERETVLSLAAHLDARPEEDDER